MLELTSFTIMGPFFVVFLVNNFASGNSCGNTGFYPEKKGKSLEHHVIDTMTTDTASLCRIMCHLKEECMSYNYQASTGTCQISDSDEHQHSAQLVNKIDHIYVGRENPCQKDPCPPPKLCQPNLRKGSRICFCPHGYQGPTCDEDIDECKTGEHDCGNITECVNTNGSFICQSNNTNAINSAVGLQNSTILTKPGDARYVNALNVFLAPVLQNPSSRWVRCWHAESDGWDMKASFHRKCDHRGPTVTIIRVGKYVFGGYTDVSWQSSTSSKDTLFPETFLFSLFNVNGYQPIKLYSRWSAIWMSFGNRYMGPTFGNDLEIFSRNRSYASCYEYDCPPRCRNYWCWYRCYCSFFAGTDNGFQLSDVEVFFEKTS